MSLRKIVLLMLMAAPCAAVGKPGLSGAPDSDGRANCARNCVAVWRSSNYLLVAARDAAGKVFKTLSFALAGEARPDSAAFPYSRTGRLDISPATADGGSSGSVCINTPGVCTETAVMRYTSPTQYIFYTFTYVFSDGNLIEVEVEETRVARSKID